MDYVLIATLLTAIGGVLVLGHHLSRVVERMQRQLGQARAQKTQDPAARLVPLSTLPDLATGTATTDPVQLVDVRRVGLSPQEETLQADAPYAMALLDERGDGVLVVSDEDNGEPHITARRVRRGRTSERLSDLEAAALNDALSQGRL